MRIERHWLFPSVSYSLPENATSRRVTACSRNGQGEASDCERACPAVNWIASSVRLTADGFRRTPARCGPSRDWKLNTHPPRRYFRWAKEYRIRGSRSGWQMGVPQTAMYHSPYSRQSHQRVSLAFHYSWNAVLTLPPMLKACQSARRSQGIEAGKETNHHKLEEPRCRGDLGF